MDRGELCQAAAARAEPPSESLRRPTRPIPHFRELEDVTYQDGGVERQMQRAEGRCVSPVPRGCAAPANCPRFRGSWRRRISPIIPSSPWYGAWYVSEALDILTQNPEVWKKTIFILCYDENDGYFDHVPPFVAAASRASRKRARCPRGSTSVEHVRQEQESMTEASAVESRGPIGLGYRVPLVIASPWSRGGYVCSQVFDHTSILQFLEKISRTRRAGPIRETNITAWRRAVCGDLTSVFRPYNGEKFDLPNPVERSLPGIDPSGAIKPPPAGFKKLDPATSSSRARRRSNAHGCRARKTACGPRARCLTSSRWRVAELRTGNHSRFHSPPAGRFLASARRAPPPRLFAGAEGCPLLFCGRWGPHEDAWLLGDFADGAYQLACMGRMVFSVSFAALRTTRRWRCHSCPCVETEL